MALANKKITNIFNKKTGGSKDSKSITDSVELDIKTKFDNGEHIEDNGMFTNLAPALYAVQQVADDIEEIRRFITSEINSITTSQANAITANTAKTGITTSQADAIVANTAKTGISTSQASAITANTAKVSQGLATANHTMQFDVVNQKGTYFLTVTIVDYTNPKSPVTKTVTLTLK